jgi:DNA-binding transcriptional regulator YiaG
MDKTVFAAFRQQMPFLTDRGLPTYHENKTTRMITGAQMRAARALLGIDQKQLAELSSLSLPTIQRMETSNAVVRGNVDSLMKLVGALDAAGIILIGENEPSTAGGRGVRLKR